LLILLAAVLASMAVSLVIPALFPACLILARDILVRIPALAALIFLSVSVAMVSALEERHEGRCRH
jgi:hypothetical protein